MSRAALESIKRKLRELAKVRGPRLPFVISYDPKRFPEGNHPSLFSSLVEYFEALKKSASERYRDWVNGLTPEQKETRAATLLQSGEPHSYLLTPIKSASPEAWLEEVLQDQLSDEFARLEHLKEEENQKETLH